LTVSREFDINPEFPRGEIYYNTLHLDSQQSGTLLSVITMSVDLADTHFRSICLGRPDEPDPPGSSTSSCDSCLDPPPPQKISDASYVSMSELWSDA
jgi:hypothetical protein